MSRGEQPTTAPSDLEGQGVADPQPGRADGRRPAGRVDASMDLLNQIIRHPVDPDYALVAGRAGGPRRRSWRLGLVLVLAGAMFAVAALQTNRAAPAVQTERTELISRIRAAETRQDQLRLQAADLTAQIGRLRSAALGDDGTSRGLERQIGTLGPVVGTVAVRGPGLLVVVDDAPTGSGDRRDQVLDIDLQILTNGLWQAGAEAVSINGHRLSALTAIRSAGDAITVDYRSLNRPYRIEAVGDPRTMPAAFVESSAGAWWNDLAQNRKMRYETSDVERLDLGTDPGITLRYARKPGS